MPERISILVPVLNRPHRVAPLVASLAASQDEVALDLLFLATDGDEAELSALKAAGGATVAVSWPAGTGDYARKINHGARLAREANYDWVFLGADDLDFHVGWAEAALREHEKTGACVIGTNDLGNLRVKTGRHSTHTLVKTEYLDCGTVDADDVLLTESYTHEYVDDEFVRTAMFRRVWAFAPRARVEHLHPDWGKADWDDTYEKARAGRYHDQALFESRRYLWGE